jgi:hypothetical protein
VRENLFCEIISPRNYSTKYSVDPGKEESVPITCKSSNEQPALIEIDCGNTTSLQKQNGQPTFTASCKYRKGTYYPSCSVNGIKKTVD